MPIVYPEFDSAARLIERARKDLDAFHNAVWDYYQRQPRERFDEVNEAANLKILKFRLTEVLNGDLEIDAKQIVSHLRDALDHAVYGATLALGTKEPKKTAFPFGEDEDDVVRNLKSRAYYRDVPPSLYSFLIEAKPYRGGNPWLFILNELRKPATHRLIIECTPAIAMKSIKFETLGYEAGHENRYGETKIGYQIWDPIRKELEFARLPIGMNFQLQMEIGIGATFKEVAAAKDFEITKLLASIFDEVETVVKNMQNEVRTIKALA